MASPRTLQDHKPKKTQPDPSAPFAFEHNGETFQLAAPEDVLTAGFTRQIRKLNQVDQLFTMIEALADEDALAAIDEMKKTEFERFQRDFFEHIGADLGE